MFPRFEEKTACIGTRARLDEEVLILGAIGKMGKDFWRTQ
jgi:hypothetical protein